MRKGANGNEGKSAAFRGLFAEDGDSDVNTAETVVRIRYSGCSIGNDGRVRPGRTAACRD